MVARETTVLQGLQSLGLALGDAAEDAADRLARLAAFLEGPGVERGILGPAEGPRILTRHILESAALFPLVGREGELVDVGSGAGLPGLVLAALGCRTTLVDSEQKKVRFLEEAATSAGLAVEVVWGRAEDLGRDPERREHFGTAVARALAPPPVALELLLPLVRPGGAAILAVGPAAVTPEALAAAAAAAAQLGGGEILRESLAVPGLDAARWAVIVPKTDTCPVRFPRRAGVPARRPLS